MYVYIYLFSGTFAHASTRMCSDRSSVLMLVVCGGMPVRALHAYMCIYTYTIMYIDGHKCVNLLLAESPYGFPVLVHMYMCTYTE